jgi:predicted porin
MNKQGYAYGVLAILAMSAAAAAAQSNVSMYGLIDVGLARESGGAAGAVTKLTSGIANGSRLGFKGKEDLGDGWSSVFVLENGLDATTGAAAQGGLLFGRQAYVGLQGPLGSIRMGRQYTPIDDLVASTDPFYNGYAGRMQNVLAQGYVARSNNEVSLSTPDLRGWCAAVYYGFGEVAGNAAAGRHVAATVNYARGPLVVRLASQNTNNAAANGAARNTLLGVIYDFGAFRLHGTAGTSKTDAAGVASVDARDLMVGVTVPFGPGNLIASFVHRDDRLAPNRDATQLALGYTYDLSKRTTLYAAYGRIDNRNGAAYLSGNATEPGTGPRAWDLGLRHRF